MTASWSGVCLYRILAFPFNPHIVNHEQRVAVQACKVLIPLRTVKKSAGLQDRTFYHYTFERCDASQENAVYAKRYVEHFKEMAQTGIEDNPFPNARHHSVSFAPVRIFFALPLLPCPNSER